MTAEFPALGDDWRSSNGFQNEIVRKVVIHTTEGSSVSGAQGVYNSRGSVHPHITYDPDIRYGVQHLALKYAAFALESKPQPNYHSYNRDGVIQIEVVGYAGRTDQYNDKWYTNLVDDVLRPLVNQTKIPPTYFLPSAGSEGYGRDADQRLSQIAWDRYTGLLGHQHVPYNRHWDPGKFRWGYVVELLAPADVMPPPLFIPPKETFSMDAEARARFTKIDAAIAALDQQQDLRFKAFTKFRDSTRSVLLRIVGAVKR